MFGKQSSAPQVPVRHVQTPLLDMAFEDGGPPDAPVVLLLHGWPDDATAWRGVASALNARGLRTIAPFWRGFGATSFISTDTPRTGDSARLAMDAVALLDALGVQRFDVAGHDWGSNAGEAIAVGWPERVTHLALLSTPSRLGGLPTPSFQQAQRQWYHWFQATRRGAEAIRKDPKGFARIQWENWSPPGWYDEATFEAVARSFDNPDWVDVTLHSYRSRWDEAEPDRESAWLSERVKATSTIATPAIYIQGEEDGINPPETSMDIRRHFSGPFERIVLDGVGHFPAREAPAETATALMKLFVEG